jgi:HEAT repeat protein
MTILAFAENPAAGDALARHLADKDLGVRMAAATGLVLRGDKRGLDPMLEAAKTRPANVRVPLSALAYVDDERAVDALETGLDDADGGYRWQATFGLAELANRKDADPATRERARHTIEGLIEASGEKRKAALAALCAVKDESAIEPLKEMDESGDAKTRADAVRALGGFDRVDTVAILLTALQDVDEGVREVAVSALSRSTDPRAVPALRATLKDKSEKVRRAAERAIPGAKCGAAQAKNADAPGPGASK